MRPLLVVQNLNIAPDLPSFLKLTPRFNFSGQAGRGTIQGALTGERGGAAITINGIGLDVGGMPFFAGAGIYGEGTISFDFQRRGAQGQIRFSIDQARLSGALAGFDAVPLNYFRAIRGMLTLGETITVNSLTMEGPGLYVRVKGEIKGRNIEGRAEIMLNSSFDQYALLQTFLERYKASPGHYVVPISQAMNR